MVDARSGSTRLRNGAWIAALLGAAVGAGAWIASHREAAVDAITTPTLVVLPLQPAGTGHDEGVLAEGLGAEWIAPLAHIRGLRVIAGTSALRAQVEHFNSRQLRARLGATHVLSGQLHDSGSEVHIDLNLRDTLDDRTLWSGTYASMLGDSAALENEIARTVATALSLRVAPGAPAKPEADPQIYRDYLAARALLGGPQRQRGIDQLRELVAKAPDYVRAQAALARTLVSDARPSAATGAALDEAARAAQHALELDPESAEAQATQAILACRGGNWARCMTTFQRALSIDPSDAETRIVYSTWLAGLGYVDRALAESERAWLADPLNYNANFTRARLLDTVGRHQEALAYLDAATPASSGLVYAKWHNAVWRNDFTTAAALAVTIPQSDGFREAYIAVSEALTEPRLWRQALPLIGTSERANGRTNITRIMMPNPDYAIVIPGLERMLRDGWPSYYLLLWMPEYAAMRRDPEFVNFLHRTRLLDYWRLYGWPSQCHPAGDGAVCG